MQYPNSNVERAAKSWAFEQMKLETEQAQDLATQAFIRFEPKPLTEDDYYLALANDFF